MVSIPGFAIVRRRYLTTRPSRKRENDEGSWLKGTFLLIVSSWLRPQEPEVRDVGRCLLPSPKITFLIDKPGDLVCQICHHSQLALRNEAEARGLYVELWDSVPAMLPCGHVAGTVFGDLAPDYESCPFCRQELVHSKCGHQVQPRHLFSQNVAFTPNSIPHGGSIPELCYAYYKAALWVSADVRYRACKRRFEQARSRHLASESQADANILLHMKVDFEKVMVEEF
ncbi:hypothetical protein BDP55DRAFT_632854 [Colletotrichum godetiae]|uniref:Uncharacterized protein n=1 Tax=Colletotrichum godetiae TaxID=1209918 RepID=A0AAJ0AJ08_9PEZI|nr:uncharacterized protein BDP55DRAFT_632854 [Colletotrichum godetiae]KAK1674790.1 hypothetical protein BDP55DRAFT_632854 [Colletotrichum godetiae]